MVNPAPYHFPWASPLTVAACIPETHENWILLYSGMRQAHSGRYSFLGLFPKAEIIAEDFTELAEKLDSESRKGHPALPDTYWFGYLGYGLRHSLEHLPKDGPSPIPMPALWMQQFGAVIRFDHDEKAVECWAGNPAHMAMIQALFSAKEAEEMPASPPVSSLSSNMTKTEYLAKVAAVKEAIAEGVLFQANITRKFFGDFAHIPSGAEAFALFRMLSSISPAPYSAFLRLKGSYILSSSPEQFITIEENGTLTSRPIKGSASRDSDPVKDAALKEALIHSSKNRAENLMITDLMRNDFARSCKAGSITVPALFECTSYATIHHLSSTITGEKRTECSSLDALAAAFPPGSMTGAPKIKAMELCSQMEQQERGIYSGAIGYISPDGKADFSVVIRTLIIQGGRFEFQVGGGIVHDSTPEEEWQETLTKATAIAKVLGIPRETLAGI